jgi:hypothetical protein
MTFPTREPNKSEASADETATLATLRLDFEECLRQLTALRDARQKGVDTKSWTLEDELNLETAENPIHDKLFDVCWRAADLRARSLEHMRTKATMLLDRCDEDIPDLQSRLAVSLCLDVLLIGCSFGEMGSRDVEPSIQQFPNLRGSSDHPLLATEPSARHPHLTSRWPRRSFPGTASLAAPSRASGFVPWPDSALARVESE